VQRKKGTKEDLMCQKAKRDDLRGVRGTLVPKGAFNTQVGRFWVRIWSGRGGSDPGKLKDKRAEYPLSHTTATVAEWIINYVARGDDTPQSLETPKTITVMSRKEKEERGWGVG